MHCIHEKMAIITICKDTKGENNENVIIQEMKHIRVCDSLRWYNLKMPDL